MAKFYVSCTTKDLGEGRRKVCNILRSAGHDVVSMDIYTSESRPSLVKCREDVEKCDVYLGIFALRYGWRPPNKEAPGDNPLGRAITELEYLHAKARGKDRLIFILDEEQALWRAALIDRDRAAIDALRQMLSDDVLTTQFTSEDDLIAKVGATLAKKYGAAQQAAPPAPVIPRVREIKHDVALFCATASDATFAQEVCASLQQKGLVMLAISVDLFPPTTAAHFEKLELRAGETRSALVVLSDAAVA